MNLKRRLIVKEIYKTAAGKITASVLPKFLRIFSKSANGKHCKIEGAGPALVSKYRDKSAMTVKPEKDIIAEISISDFLFLGCLF